MAWYQDREWLELMYHGREHTQTEMADQCGVSPRTIRKYMAEHGIPTREVRGRNHGRAEIGQLDYESGIDPPE